MIYDRPPSRNPSAAAPCAAPPSPPPPSPRPPRCSWRGSAAPPPGGLSALSSDRDRSALTADAADSPTDREPPPPTEPPPFADAPTTVPAAPRAGLHDAATSALIAEELALAAPADRAALAKEWAELDAAMVEQVIRIRRMVRQLDAEPAAGSAVSEFAAPAVAAPDPFAANRPVAPPARFPAAADPFDPAGAVVPAVVPAVAPAAAEDYPPATPAEAGRPMVDPNLRPAAYQAAYQPPAPPAADRPAPLFPGVPVPAATKPAPPAASPRPPVRTAENLPSPAALLTPGAARAAPGPSPAGPTGFGRTPDAAPFPADRGPLVPPPLSPGDYGGGETGDYADRLDDLIAAAKRRERRLADAAATAADPLARDAAEAALAEAGVHLRLLHLLAGDHGRALEAVAALPPAEQEFWQHAVWGLSSTLDRESIPDPADRATQAAALFRTAATKLSAAAKLTLRNVNFCHRVDSFGNAVPFERDEFTPNQPVLIYAEVENFTSEQNPRDGRFLTQTRSTVQIFEAGGERLIETLPLDEPITADTCDRHRQDYFLVYDLKIPARIGLGPHVMKLTVEDTLGGQTVETRLNFTVK